MSIKVMTFIWDNYDGSNRGASRKLMMLALADFCDDEGVCYPGIKRLAEKCDLTRRGARKILDTLQEHDEVYVETHNGIKTTHGHTNRYFLIQYRKSVGLETKRKKKNNGGNSSTSQSDGGNSSTSQGGNSNTPQGGNSSSPKPLVEPSEEPTTLTDAKDAPTSDTADKRDYVWEYILYICFDIRYDTLTEAQRKQAVGNFGRVNKIKKTITDAVPDIGKEDIRGFYKWWRKEYPDITVPKSDQKFLEHFLSYKLSGTEAQTDVTYFTAVEDDVTDAERLEALHTLTGRHYPDKQNGDTTHDHTT